MESDIGIKTVNGALPFRSSETFRIGAGQVMELGFSSHRSVEDAFPVHPSRREFGYDEITLLEAPEEGVSISSLND